MPEVLKPIVALLVVVLVLGFVIVNGNDPSTLGMSSSSTSMAVEKSSRAATTTTVPLGAAVDDTVLSAVMNDADREASLRVARALFDGINRERRTRELPQLVWDDELARGAQAWSEHLASADSADHRDAGGGAASIVPGLSVFGENVFRSATSVSALTIHRSWMQTDEDRHNILQTGYDRVGIGVFCGPDGSVYAAQDFGGGKGADVTSSIPSEQPTAWTTGAGPSCD